MELIPKNTADIIRYYLKSYIKLKEFGDELFWVRAVNEEEITLIDKDDKEYIIHLHEDAPYTLDMLLPNKSMYQIGTRCFHLYRVPARQFHRGITVSNCKVESLGATVWSKVEVGFTSLDGYVKKPAFFDLKTAIESSNVSCALTKRFAYSAGGGLWCGGILVGAVSKDKSSIKIKPILVPEIQSLLASTGLSGIFKVN